MTKLGSCLALAVLLLAVPAAQAEEMSDAESFALWRAQAETGAAVAQFNVGWSYYAGKGVQKDVSEAERWYRRAAEQGHADAQHNLALLLVELRGAAGVAEAYPWERQAAAGGSALAKQNLPRMEAQLGYAYETGAGVEKDLREAALHYQAAAEAGDAHAQYNLGLLLVRGGGIARDPRAAEAWFEKAAAQNIPGAKEALERLRQEQAGPQALTPERVAALRAEAERGDAAAMTELGFAYRDGSGVAQDHAQAVAWLREAAEAGDRDAQAGLGTAYDTGEGTPRDPTEAARWYRRAAEQGHAGAQFCLGAMLVNGEGVPKDVVEGLMWLNLSRDELHSSRYLIFRLEGLEDAATLAEGRRRADAWQAQRRGAVSEARPL